jgi:hypothetical protein
VGEIAQMACESAEVLKHCRESIDNFVDFAYDCRPPGEKEHQWVEEVINYLKATYGSKGLSIVTIAALMREMHEAGMVVLETNLQAMVTEAFSEKMA